MGWDGDALAEQLEDAAERQQEAAAERKARAGRDHSSSEDRARAAELESLRLSKARILEQLGRATNPARREMLERALRSIESKMNG